MLAVNIVIDSIDINIDMFDTVNFETDISANILVLNEMDIFQFYAVTLDNLAILSLTYMRQDRGKQKHGKVPAHYLDDRCATSWRSYHASGITAHGITAYQVRRTVSHEQAR